MRKLALLALAGAGLGYLLKTEQGRRMLSQAGDYMTEGRQRFQNYFAQRRGVEAVVEDRLQHDPPDTAMAQAFEEAVNGAA